MNSNLRNQLERLQGEKEEREKEVVFYCNALEVFSSFLFTVVDNLQIAQAVLWFLVKEEL